MSRKKGDVKLNLSRVPVFFARGPKGWARAEGNNAAWQCRCKEQLPLLGRCYFWFGHYCHTVCPGCGKKFRVQRDPNTKKTTSVREIV